MREKWSCVTTSPSHPHTFSSIVTVDGNKFIHKSTAKVKLVTRHTVIMKTTTTTMSMMSQFDDDNDDDDDKDDVKVEGVTGHTVITEFSGDKVVRSEMENRITPLYGLTDKPSNSKY